MRQVWAGLRVWACALACCPGLCRAPDFAGAPFACLIRRWLSPLARLQFVSNRHLKVSIDGRRSQKCLVLANFAGLALANCCRSQLLPPELLALVQLPVLRWSFRPVMCRVAVTLPVAARSALPPRLSTAPGLRWRPNTALVAQRCAVARCDHACFGGRLLRASLTRGSPSHATFRSAP